MMCRLLSGYFQEEKMNIKRFISAAVVLFGFIFLYEWLVHGMLLQNIYQETASVWRSHEEMQSYLHFNFLLIAVVSLWATFIFTRFYPDGGWNKGLCFGAYLGIFSGIQAFAAYFYIPIPLILAVAWFIASFVEYLIGGVLIGAIYRK